MATITDRIKYLVDTMAKSKAEFGRRIGTTGAAVTQLYYGKTLPSGTTIIAICEAFGVNREWLEQGEGEPFKRDELTEWLESVHVSTLRACLIRQVNDLTPEQVAALYAAMRRWIAEVEDEMEKEKLAEYHKEVDRQHGLEKGEAGKSSASYSGSCDTTFASTGDKL